MNEHIIDAEVVDQSHALATQQYQAPALFPEDPNEVLKIASARATALMDVVDQKKLFTMIQGRKHLTVEAWQTLAVLSGVTPFTEWCRQTENGWEARVTVRNRAGMDIGAAEAQCSRDERTWKSRDDYAIRSMAQTRATSKAIRSVLAFIAVLAGYEGTPSDEMPNSEDSGAPQAPSKPQAAQDSWRYFHPKSPEPAQSPVDPLKDPTPFSAAESAKLKALIADEVLIPAEISAIIAEVLENPEAGVVADIKTRGQGRAVANKIIKKKREVKNETPL